MESINLPQDPTAFLKHYFGDKFIVLSIKNNVTQYAIGDLDSVELAFLSKVVDVISAEKIKGVFDENS